jgi:hypothetical protein
MSECGIIDVLHVEDDPGYALTVRKSFAQASRNSRLHAVTDGRQALRFLRRAGEHVGAPSRAACLLRGIPVTGTGIAGLVTGLLLIGWAANGDGQQLARFARTGARCWRAGPPAVRMAAAVQRGLAVPGRLDSWYAFQVSPGSRAGPGTGTGGGASASSWTRSA